jgi:hypothetical protein
VGEMMSLHLCVSDFKTIFMKNVLTFLTALFIGFSSSFAQQVQTANNIPKDAYQGSFEHREGKDAINVNYEFSPKTPTDKVMMFLHTPFANPLWLKIVNSEGKTLLLWKPTTPNYLHTEELNVQSLPSGNYHYQIYWAEEGVIKSIPFIKK